MANVYKTGIDIKNVRHNFRPVFVQYDHAKLEIELMDNGRNYDLTKAERVEFTHIRNDGVVIIQPGEIVINSKRQFIQYEYQGSEMTILGVVKTSFAIFYADNKKVSSHSFNVSIVEDLREEVFETASPNLGLVQKLVEDVASIKKAGGIKGEPGYTPIKGIDYFDGVNGDKGEPGYTPVKGTDYFDGVNGKDGEPFTFEKFTPQQLASLKGDRGEKGESGYAPVKGVDYFDGKSFTFDDFTEEQLTSLKGEPGDINLLTETMADVPFVLVTGYRASSTGVFNAGGTLWRTANPINNTSESTYKFVYSYDQTAASARVFRYDSNGQYLQSFVVPMNEEFILTDDVDTFSFNLSLPNAQPNTTPPLPNFQTIEALNSIKLVKIEAERETLVTKSILNESINQIKYLNNKTIKILMIGNSFSEDVSQYIHQIANSAGVNVIFGNLHRPGETLEGHLAQINSGTNSYTFYKRTSVDGVVNQTTTPNTSFLNGLKNEEWDIVTYQQGSPLSGVYSSFNPYLSSIIQYVNTNKTNPNAVNALHMTWAYPTTSAEAGFSNYNRNQVTMYNAIVDAYQQAMRDNDIDIIIPVGTAIQNARTIPYLQSLNNDMASDGFHLGPVGDYIAGLTLFETLVASKYNKDIFNDVTYTVESKFLSYLGKIAVKNAVLKPFNVTDI